MRTSHKREELQRQQGKMKQKHHSVLGRRRQGFGASKAGKVIHRKKKRKCLVNKYLLDHLETMGHREDFDQMGFAAFLSTTPSPFFYYNYLWWHLFLGLGLLAQLFLGTQGEVQRFFLSLLDLACFLLKITHMPDQNIAGWPALNSINCMYYVRIT